MASLTITVRHPTTGEPVPSVDVEVRTIDGDTLLDTITTDADGVASYEADGSPGPIVMVTDYGGTTRKRSGQNKDQVGVYYLADIPRILRLLGDGVIAGYTDPDTAAGDLAVTPGTGRRVNVAAGAMLVDGVLYRRTTAADVDVTENVSGSTRYDGVVARLTREGQATEGEFDVVMLDGTTSATGPTLTKSDATREVILARVRVVNGASSFVSGDLTDLRYSPDYDQAYIQLNPNAFARSASYENGDILMVSGGKLVRLAKGSDGQYLGLSSGLPAWSTPTLTVVVQEGDVTIDAAATTLDFVAADFNVTSTPSGEANIALSSGIDATKLADGSVDNTELQYLSGVTANIQTQLDGKSATGHTHGDTGIDVYSAGAPDATDVTIINFGTSFNVSETPAGQANITTNFGTGADEVAEGDHTHEAYPVLFAPLASDTLRQVTGTLADVETVDIGPLVDGVTYDIECDVDMRASVDTGTGFVVAYARIGGDSSVAGTKTGTTGGERSIHATATAEVVGTGASVTLRARAQMSGGTDGSISATMIRGRAFPRNIPAT